MVHGKQRLAVSCPWLIVLVSVVTLGQQAADKVKIISVPQPEFRVNKVYDGALKVELTTFEDSRFVEDPKYLGVTQTGLFNHPRPLLADADAGKIFENAIRLGLSKFGVAAAAPAQATVSLRVKLLSIAYSEETFMASEYGMAEILFQAHLASAQLQDAAPALNGKGDSKDVLVRAFYVRAAGDATKYAPYVVQMSMMQAVERLLGSASFKDFVEPEKRDIFCIKLQPSPDLDKWLKKQKGIVEPNKVFVTKPSIDLSEYQCLHLADITISDAKYGDRARTAARETRQVLFTRLIEQLHKKFSRFTSGNERPPGRAVAVSCDFYDYVPYRPGTQAFTVGLFGAFGVPVGRGRLAGTVILRDAQTNATIAELPFKASANFRSNQKMIEELAASIAAFLSRCKGDAPEPGVEVSCAEG